MVLVSGLDDEGGDQPEGSAHKERQSDQGSREAVLGSENERPNQEEQGSRNDASNCAMKESAGPCALLKADQPPLERP